MAKKKAAKTETLEVKKEESKKKALVTSVFGGTRIITESSDIDL